ncbi:hypothetical protein IV500_06500 [Paeniglutamicibacter antarcticus]|uniref:Asl1-like glycosyl hydrolase catalytic domain-containing protein n=1 Tax=Arthrobacter terrae TaxID=2935737 RepID=A0A931CM83_9MICC|nr:glycosyl hydrolase [Arthrobacter terrae]MBG0739050.1 hypothetical protein [Arthrobacter terrae]
MDRRKFLKLSTLAVPGAILAASAVPAPALADAPLTNPTTRVLKGFGTSAKADLAVKQMLQLELDWFYTWGKLPALGRPVNDFTPMIWGASSATPAVITEIESNLWKTGSTRLLGFNEPDHRDQSNMSVDRALELWPILEKTKLKLGSPATISPNTPWMNDFMTRAFKQGRRVDFVATHIYQSPDAKNFLRKVDELHERWGKPVWITETAVADWDATATKPSRYGRTQVNEYLQEIWVGVQKRSFVERFAWKTRASVDPTMGSSALFHTDGTITSTGKLYASF